MNRIGMTALVVSVLAACAPSVKQRSVESGELWVEVLPDASVRVLDKRSGLEWSLGSPRIVNGMGDSVKVKEAETVRKEAGRLSYESGDGTSFHVQLDRQATAVEYSFDAGPDARQVYLLDMALAVTEGSDSYYAVPQAGGARLSAGGAKSWIRRLDRDREDGYSMPMCGIVRNGSAALVTFDGDDTAMLINHNTGSIDDSLPGSPELLLSLAFRADTGSMRLELLGQGGYVDIARKYRDGLETAGDSSWREGLAGVPLFRLERPGSGRCGKLIGFVQKETGSEKGVIVADGDAADSSAVDSCAAAAGAGGWTVVRPDQQTGLQGGLLARRVMAEETDLHDVGIPLFALVHRNATALTGSLGEACGWRDTPCLLWHLLHGAMPLFDGDGLLDKSPALVRAFKDMMEVLEPLHRSAWPLPMTDHALLRPGGEVQRSRFGDNIEVVVNFGESNFSAGETVLPPYGFLVKSPEMVSYCAVRHDGIGYQQPTFVVIRSLDGEVIEKSREVRVYRGFGGNRVRVRGEIVEVDSEVVLRPTG